MHTLLVEAARLNAAESQRCTCSHRRTQHERDMNAAVKPALIKLEAKACLLWHDSASARKREFPSPGFLRKRLRFAEDSLLRSAKAGKMIRKITLSLRGTGSSFRAAP